MIYLIIIISTFSISFFLTYLIRAYALKNNVIDKPNQRSSHSVPTPRGGGVAIVVSFFIGFLMLYVYGIVSGRLFYSIIISGSITAVVGFVDDHRHIAARWRFLIHILASLVGVFFLGGELKINLLGYNLTAGWLFLIPGLLYLTWMLNLYNFMDGINGLASMEAIFFSLASCVILYCFNEKMNDSGLLLVLSIMASAAAGFILWNFPFAKIFMGDAGSGFLGMILGLLILHISTLNKNLFLAELCLLGIFIVDATITLVRRFFSGKKIYEAHSSHSYQIFSRKVASHSKTTVYAFLINLFWLLPWAMMISKGIVTGVIGVFIAWLPLVVIALVLGAGVTEKAKGQKC